MGKAQSKKDSLAREQASWSARTYTDSVEFTKLKFAATNPFYLVSLMPEKVSNAGFSYVFERGHFRAAQQASTLNKGNFFTEGSTTLGSIRLFGRLLYQKVIEDSTAFAHQSRSNPGTPYYYGSPANVHYDRTRYAFQAMAGKSLLDNTLEIAIGTRYKVGNHFSTNDPRGAIKEYQFDLNANVAYRLSEGIKMGMGFGHGYGRESVNIGYKNPRYYESSAFPVYYNHLVNGYREWDDALKVRMYDDKMVRNEAQFYIDLTTPHFGKLYLNGTFRKEKQHYFYSSSDGFVPYSDYLPETITVNGLWLKELKSLTYGARLQFVKTDGKDYNLNFGANNYLYNAMQSGIQVFVQKNAGKNLHYYTLSAGQHSEERTDGISGNNVFYNQLNITAGYSIKHAYAIRHHLGLDLHGGWQLPLNSSLQVVQDAGYFTQYVINRDYLYNTASALTGTFKIAWGFPLFSSMKSEIGVTAAYQHKLNEKTINRIIISSPGNNRFYSTMQLNLYF